MKKVLFLTFTIIAFFLVLGCFGEVGITDSQDELVLKKVNDGAISLTFETTPSSIYADVKGIYISVEEVWYQDGGWEKIEWYVPGTYNLITDVGEAATILDYMNLPEGRYNKLRLILDYENCYVEINGIDNEEVMTYPLEIPTSDQRGLDLIGNFDIVGDELTQIFVLLDIEKSLTITGKNRYILRPVLKVVVENTIWF